MTTKTQPYFPTALIDAFMQAPPLRNDWLISEVGQVYVRKGKRYIEGQTYDTFEIANVSWKEEFRGQGVFTSLLFYVERLGYTVFIECVLNERLRDFLFRRGYQVRGEMETPDMFKICGRVQ